MPRKRVWGSRKKKRLITPSLIGAVGLVVTALIAALVLQRTMPHRETVAERLPPPDFAGLLPAGAEAGAGGALELADYPQSSYVVGYKAQNGEIAVALITWDRNASRYHVASTLALAVGDSRLESVPTLTAVPLGRGEPVAVVAKGSAGAYIDGVFVLVRQGDELRFIAKKDKDGKTGIAFFLSGASMKRSEEVEFGDVDGDAVKEAVATESQTDDHHVKKETVSVYRLQDGYYTYDTDLSWALTKSKTIFPEPQVPPSNP